MPRRIEKTSGLLQMPFKINPDLSLYSSTPILGLSFLTNELLLAHIASQFFIEVLMRKSDWYRSLPLSCLPLSC